VDTKPARYAVYLSNIKQASSFQTVDIGDILASIQDGRFNKALSSLPASDTKDYKTAKAQLPAWALNGEFENKVTNDGFIKSNGLFHIDIDGLDNVADFKAHVIESIPELYALWKSPSGHGLKGLLSIPFDVVKNDADFKKAFSQIEAYLASFNITIDKSCKDVRRLCFVCSDSAIYINEAARVFAFDTDLWAKTEKPIAKPAVKNAPVYDKSNVYIERACNLIYQSVKGEHHNARLRAGKLAGGFIAAGLVNEFDITAALMVASDFICAQYGDNQDTVRKEQCAVKSGIESGRMNPVEPDKERHFSPRENPPPQDGHDSNQAPVSNPIDWFAQFKAELTAANDDIDKVIAISRDVQLADLHPAKIDLLLKQAAKQVGVSIASLRLEPKADKATSDNSGGNDAVDDADFIDKLNDKHAVVPVGGRVFIMNKEYDATLDRELLTFSPKADFVLRYCNKKTSRYGDDYGTAWLDHPNRRQYEGIIFSPGHEIDGYYNLFRGFHVKPVEGDCSLFMDFMFLVICNRDLELFNWTWKWLAHLMQKPEEMPGSALVLRGKEGIGKNRFVNTIGHLIGVAHFIELASIQQVVGRFSGHLTDKLLVFANEAIWGGDKQSEGVLKNMITDRLSSVEYKGKDIFSVRNYKRVIAASNEDWVIPRGIGDRRWVIYDVSDCYKEDLIYFEAIEKELVNGGYEALMYELMTTDLTGYTPRLIPTEMKMAGWELKIMSGGTILAWWFDCLDKGYFETNGENEFMSAVWWDMCKKEDVHAHYLRWCEKHKKAHPETNSVMGRKLKEFGVKDSRPRSRGMIPHYNFQSLEESRQLFSELLGIPVEYWNENSSE
jgi:hypothetical protein